MRRTIVWFLLAALLLIPHADGADDGGVRRAIAGYRAWKPTTTQPILVPDRTTTACGPYVSPEQRNPHEGRHIFVYVSPAARDAYERKTSYPDGTVIVKEKRTKPADDETLELGVMIKHGKSWEYSYIDADGKIADGERLLHCARCHARAQNDSVFGRAAAAPAPNGPRNGPPNGNGPGAAKGGF